jgi:hypothetical protein
MISSGLEMLLDLGKAFSFFLSVMTLSEAMISAFLIPGTRWEERLVASGLRLAIAGCVCFASGILFNIAARAQGAPIPPLIATFPVRLFLWTLLGMAILFALAWYLDAYYVPLLWRYQP